MATIAAEMRKAETTRIVTFVVTVLAIAAILIPPAIALWFIYSFGVDTVVLDDFDFILMFDKLSKGTLTLQDLTSQHNEHRFFFGRLVMLGLGVPTRLSSLAQMYASWGFGAASGSVLLCLFIRLFGRGPLSLFMFVPVSFLLFNLKAYEVFLYGILLTNSMMIFFFLLTLYLNYQSQFSRRPWVLFGWSLASAFVSTFAGSGGGLLVWPIGFFQLVAMLKGSASEAKQQLRQMAGSWILSSTLAVLLYFHNWKTVNDPLLPGQSAESISRFTDYALILFGTPFAWDTRTSQLLGGLVILLYIFAATMSLWNIFLRRGSAGVVPSACMMFFGLFVQLMIVLGRAGTFEPGQAASPRYAQLAYIGLIGIYLGCLCSRGMNSLSTWSKSSVLLVVLGLVISAVTAGYAQADSVGFYLRDQHRRFAYYLRNFELQTDETLREIYPGPVRGFAHRLARLRYNVFAREPFDDSSLPHVGGHAQGFIDTVDNAHVTGRSQPIVISQRDNKTFSLGGSAFDPISRASARKLTLLIDGKQELPVCYGLHRLDVASALHSNLLEDCGFMVSCAPTVLPLGRHELSLRVVASDGKCVSITPSLLTIDVR